MTILEDRAKILSKLPNSFEEPAKDERFLALAICGESGELANMIKKQWRDGVDLREDIKDEIADIRIYLELMAKLYDIEGDKLDLQVKNKMNRKLNEISRTQDA